MMELLQEHDFLKDFDFEHFNYDYPPIHTVMIDDSLGSPLISSRGKEAQIFNNFAIRHRHFFSNLFLIESVPETKNREINIKKTTLFIGFFEKEIFLKVKSN